jgi:chitodextrinase
MGAGIHGADRFGLDWPIPERRDQGDEPPTMVGAWSPPRSLRQAPPAPPPQAAPDAPVPALAVAAPAVVSSPGEEVPAALWALGWGLGFLALVVSLWPSFTIVAVMGMLASGFLG